MFSLHPGPTIKISPPLAWQSVDQFCGRVKPPFIANDSDSDSYRLGNFQRNHFKFPTSSQNSGGLARMLLDFKRSNEIKFEINQTVFDKMDFYHWYKKKENNQALSLENFKIDVKVEDLKTFLKEKGISDTHLNILEMHYDQCLTSPLATSITSLIIQPRTNSTCGALPTKQCYFNFDEPNKIHFESRLSIKIKDTLVPPNIFELGVVGCKGACDLNSSANISDVGCSNPLMEDVIAENIPQTFAEFQQKADNYRSQETAAQKHYRSLYTVLEPVLTKLNSAYTIASEGSGTASPQIVFASDLTRPLLDLDGFTDNLVKQISDNIPGTDRGKNQNRLDYYFDLRKKPRAFRNSHEIAHFEKVIKAAKELNQAYDNWCVDPLDMQRLREVKLKLLQLQRMIEAIANDDKLTASSELKKHVRNELIKKNSPFIPIYEQLDTLVETFYNTPQTYRNLKQKKQDHLLLEISPLAAAMQDEGLVSGVLNRDAEARKNPSKLVLQSSRLQPGQYYKILNRYQHNLEIQNHFAQKGKNCLASDVEPYQPRIKTGHNEKNINTRTILADLDQTNGATSDVLQQLFFSELLLPSAKTASQQSVDPARILKVKLDVAQNPIDPSEDIEVKERNLQFTLTHYSSSVLQPAYNANKNRSSEYIRKSSLYLWLRRANETEIVTAWRNNPAIPTLFALDKNIAIELMQESVHFAVFFMDNAKARKQAKLEKTDFESSYGRHKNNQKFIDRLIKNKIYRGWINESRVKAEHSSGRWIFRKPNLLAAETSTASYSYLIESRRFDQIKFPVSLDLKLSDAQRMVSNCDEVSLKVLFNALLKNKDSILRENRKGLHNIIKKALIPKELEQLNTSIDMAELKLSASIRENPELALAITEYLEKRYYAENPKEDLLEQLVELACADRSGNVAERLLATSVWKRLLKTHPSTQLKPEQLEKIANTHENNAVISNRISAESFFGYSHAAKIQAKVNVDFNALQLELATQDKQLLKMTNGLSIQLLGKLITAYEANSGSPDNQQIKFGGSPSEPITLALIKKFLKHANWDSNLFNAKAVFNNAHWVNFIVENKLLSTEKLAELLAKPELGILIQFTYPMTPEQAKQLEREWASRAMPFEAIPNTPFEKIAKAAADRRELTPEPVPPLSKDKEEQVARNIKFKPIIKSQPKNWAAIIDDTLTEVTLDEFINLDEDSKLMDYWSSESRQILFTLPNPPEDNYLYKIFEKIKTQKNSRWYINQLTVEQIQALFTNTTDPAKFKDLCESKVTVKKHQKVVVEHLFQNYFAQFDYKKLWVILNTKSFPFHEVNQARKNLLSPILAFFNQCLTRCVKKLTDFNTEIQQLFKLQQAGSVDTVVIAYIVENITDDELLENLLSMIPESQEAFNVILQEVIVKSRLLAMTDQTKLAQLAIAIETWGDAASKQLLPVGKQLTQLLNTLSSSDWLTVLFDSSNNVALFNVTWQNESVKTKILEISDPDQLAQLILAIEAHGDELSKASSPDEAQRNPGGYFPIQSM